MMEALVVIPAEAGNHLQPTPPGGKSRSWTPAVAGETGESA